MGRELMAPRTDHTTRVPSSVASSVTTNHAAKGSVFVDLKNAGNAKKHEDACTLGMLHQGDILFSVDDNNVPLS